MKNALRETYVGLYCLSMKTKIFHLAVIVAVFVYLSYLGYIRVEGGKFSWEIFMSRPREYLLLMVGGLFFGWSFTYSAGQFINSLGGGRSPARALSLIGMISPVLYLVTIHQARFMLTDGPATITMAAGALLCLFTEKVASGRGL